MSVWSGTVKHINAYVYVDGAYVREQLRQLGLSDEFDPTKPASFVRNESLGQIPFWPVRTFYYDAVDVLAAEDEQVKLQNYLKKVERLPDTTVKTGYVTRRGRRRQQKAVDVQLAVDALEAAHSGVVGAIALVAGDGDFAPLLEGIQRAGPHVLVLGFEGHLSDELRDVADRVLVLPPKPGDWGLR